MAQYQFKYSNMPANLDYGELGSIVKQVPSNSVCFVGHVTSLVWEHFCLKELQTESSRVRIPPLLLYLATSQMAELELLKNQSIIL